MKLRAEHIPLTRRRTDLFTVSYGSKQIFVTMFRMIGMHEIDVFFFADVSEQFAFTRKAETVPADVRNF